MKNENANHTPGPWLYSKNIGESEGDSPAWIDTKGRPHSFTIAKCPPGTESHANARLIAAAPELLSLLKEEVEAHESGDYGPLDSEQADWLREARAAIAKAEGK